MTVSPSKSKTFLKWEDKAESGSLVSAGVQKGYHSIAFSAASQASRDDNFISHCADVLMIHLHSCIHEFNTVTAKGNGVNNIGECCKLVFNSLVSLLIFINILAL